MKKLPALGTLIIPTAEGWIVRVAGAEEQRAAGLAEVVALLPLVGEIVLALPERFVVSERMTLPSVDAAELEGMVELQLEKSLPYGIEEVAFEFEVVRRGEAESEVFAVVAQASQLEELCEPLRAGGRLPSRIGLFAKQAVASTSGVCLCVWVELGQVVLAVAESGVLGFVHSLPDASEETLRQELPRMLLAAEMAGASGAFEMVRLDPALSEWEGALGELMAVPVKVGAFLAPTVSAETAGAGSLAPARWQAEVEQMQRRGQLRQRLQVGALVYLLFVACAFLYLGWMQYDVRQLDVRLARTQPLVDFVSKHQTQWNQLAPAIDPDRYLVEVLRQVHRSRPSGEVKITVFEAGPGQFKVEGEAPSANLAIEFKEKLRAEQALEPYRIEGPPPNILPTGGARYVIFGKP
jgi:hypothetical protein